MIFVFSPAQCDTFPTSMAWYSLLCWKCRKTPTNCRFTALLSSESVAWVHLVHLWWLSFTASVHLNCFRRHVGQLLVVLLYQSCITWSTADHVSSAHVFCCTVFITLNPYMLRLRLKHPYDGTSSKCGQLSVIFTARRYVVFAVCRCLSVCHVGALYPHRWRYQTSF